MDNKYDEKRGKKKENLIWSYNFNYFSIFTLLIKNIRYVRANMYIIDGLVPVPKSGETAMQALERSIQSFKKAADIGGIAEMESRNN